MTNPSEPTEQFVEPMLQELYWYSVAEGAALVTWSDVTVPLVQVYEQLPP